MSPAHRILVISGDLGFAVVRGIVAIDRAVTNAQWLILDYRPNKTIRQLLRSQWRNLIKHGWRWVPYQLADIGRRLRRRIVADADRVSGDAPGADYTLARLLLQPNVVRIVSSDLTDAAMLDRIRAFAPDLALSLAAPILKPDLFSLPRLGTINLHKGKVPEYRGMPPAFWELWNGEQSVGCTVHRVTSGLDKGDVIAATSVAVKRYSTVKGLQLTLDELGVSLMRDAAVALLAGHAQPRMQAPGGQTRTKPTLAQLAEQRRRERQRLPTGPGALQRVAKSLFLIAEMWAVRLRRRLLGRGDVLTVILYHRVNDDLRDSLTVGVEQFDRQMAFLREHCDVVSIEDVVRGACEPKSSRPRVCVTFDDGYADNYTDAVPILLRQRIPAAFFVSTGMIDSGRGFPHDNGKVPVALPNMTWVQLRSMRAEGFVVGSHTVNHIDCARDTEETVRRELRESCETLRRQLDIADVVLAYPFGGRDNMTPARLEMVKQSGFSGCLSAYGGFNIGAIDRFNVLRCGINWTFSDLAFKSRVHGVR